MSSLSSIDWELIDVLIRIDEENNRFIWDSTKQKDNFIEMLTSLRWKLNVIMKGKPYEIRKGIYAWDFQKSFRVT